MTALAEMLRRAANDEPLIEIGRRAIEDELIAFRDDGLSQLMRGNGLVIRGADGAPSSIVRFGPDVALRIGMMAMAEFLASLRGSVSGVGETTLGSEVATAAQAGRLMEEHDRQALQQEAEILTDTLAKALTELGDRVESALERVTAQVGRSMDVHSAAVQVTIDEFYDCAHGAADKSRGELAAIAADRILGIGNGWDRDGVGRVPQSEPDYADDMAKSAESADLDAWQLHLTRAIERHLPEGDREFACLGVRILRSAAESNGDGRGAPGAAPDSKSSGSGSTPDPPAFEGMMKLWTAIHAYVCVRGGSVNISSGSDDLAKAVVGVEEAALQLRPLSPELVEVLQSAEMNAHGLEESIPAPIIATQAMLCRLQIQQIEKALDVDHVTPDVETEKKP